MDRRTFLKTLVALGVATQLPDLSIASAGEVDLAWGDWSKAWGLFEVNDYRTLSFANFEEPRTRRQAYCLPEARQIGSDDVEACEPLGWHLRDVYLDTLEQALLARGLPIDWIELYGQAEDGWKSWFDSVAGAEGERVVASIDAWLDQEPDGAREWEYYYKTGSAQGAAYDYFLRVDPDTRAALGVVIIEGCCPGSTYYAAELHNPPEKANRVAAALGLDIRFV